MCVYRELDWVNIAWQGVLRLDCHRCTVCIGHSLCEMTLISLLPNLAESISPAIREEEGGREQWRREGEEEREEGEAQKGGRKGGTTWVVKECPCPSSAYHSMCFCVCLNLPGH